MASRKAHNLEAGGSSPPSATNGMYSRSRAWAVCKTVEGLLSVGATPTIPTMDVRIFLEALGSQAEKNFDPSLFDSRYYHSFENCGVELDVSRRGNVFCPMHSYVRICHCGWTRGHHYHYV